jgi:hypothetical protein
MPLQEPIYPGQIKPESCREPETSSRLQQTNVNLQAPRNGAHGYSTDAGEVDKAQPCFERKGSLDLPQEGLALGRRWHVRGCCLCVQRVAVTPGDLLADAYLIRYTRGASEKD